MSATVGRSEVHILGNLLAPASGATHGAKFGISLAGAVAKINWAGMLQGVGSWTPQAATIDNTASSNDVTFTDQSTGWAITVLAGYRQTFQMPAVDNPEYTLEAPAGAASPILWLWDWPAFPDTSFNPNSIGGTTVLIGGQPISVVLQGTGLPPAPVTYVAAAVSTVATGGTPVVVFPAGTVITGAIITNPSTATEMLFVDPVGNAGTLESGSTFGLAAGQSFTFGPAAGAITANAVTNGHTFSATRY